MGFFKKLLPPTAAEHDEPVESVPTEGSGVWSIPDRYRIKKLDDATVLTCLESPNLVVRVQRGKVIGAQAARKSPERTIFLDGAAAGEPFMDHERQVYNLDHHEGVERSITLATCEQALIMVRKGLNLKEKNWTIYSNEPDLDTIFAIWLLLNHLHISPERSHVFSEIVPLVRLEGMIDSLGLEHTDLLAFPPELLEKTRRKLERLREDELLLKKEGRWNEADATTYTCSMLKKLDNIIFRVSDFRDFKGVVEIARADITRLDTAVMYHCDMGIYELEEYITRLYGKKPTFIFLQRDRRHYTVRKGDMFSPLKTERLYEILNAFDPAVSGQDPENRWGGSTDIGGSPRTTGTALSSSRIMELCARAFFEVDPVLKARLLISSVLTGVVPQMLGWVVLLGGMMTPRLESVVTVPFGLSTGVFAAILLLVAALLYLYGVRPQRTAFGFRLPAGWEWLRWLPLPALFAAAGGLWIPLQYHLTGGPVQWLFGAIFLPLLSALLYFSIIHGRLIAFFPIERYAGPWFISIPALFTALSYAAGGFLLPIETYRFVDLAPMQDGWSGHLVILPGYFLYGLSLAILRERTESILPVFAAHVLICAAAMFFA